MTVSAQMLSIACGDSFSALYGSPNAMADKVASLGAIKSGALIFVKSPDAQIAPVLESLLCGVLIAPPSAAKNIAIPSGCAVLECDNPRLSFARCVAAHFSGVTQNVGIHSTAVVEPSATIHPSASIGPHCYVGDNCIIGQETIIHPHVTIQRNCHIGARVIINSGTVIGADGFGYEQNSSGGYEKFPHSGGVRIDDDVDIGANSCVDRGVLDNTWIKRGAKIDNLVHISHNVVIGEDAIVIALTMLGGSVVVGDRAWIAPSATVINQRVIGADATVGLSAVVTKDVQDRQTVMGSPAVDQAQFKATNAAIKRLLL